MLVVGGLLFFYGVIGSPASYVWAHFVVEGHIFSGSYGLLWLRILDLVPECLVAAGLGWVLPRYVESPRTGGWAFAFALYLSTWYYFRFQWVRPGVSEGLIHLGAAVLLGVSAFTGFFLASRSRLHARIAGAT